MNEYLLLSGVTTVLIGVVHSIMGEWKIIAPISKLTNLPVTQGSSESTKRTIRFAWHVTSVLGFGIGGVLLYFANQQILAYDQVIVTRILSASLCSGFLVSVIGSKGMHPAWIALLLASVLSWLGTL